MPSYPDLPALPFIVPTYPHLTMPNIHLPDAPELPEWVLFLVECTKIWMPIVIGIAVGIMAMRNQKIRTY